MPGSAAHELAPHAPRSTLLCQVGSLVCGLPLEHIIETLRPLPLLPFDGMPPFVSGLSVIRGAPVPVVDLGRLLGNEQSATRGRWVLARTQDRRVALAVEQVIGVRTLSTPSLSALPPLLGEASAEFVSRVGALDVRLLVVLESGRVLPESAWASLQVGGGRA
ncbi:MAG: chemotaxis protein CheW [Polyangiaceae bacterium]